MVWTEDTAWPVVDDFVNALPLGAAAKAKLKRKLKSVCAFPAKCEYVGTAGGVYHVKLTPGAYMIASIDPNEATFDSMAYSGDPDETL